MSGNVLVGKSKQVKQSTKSTRHGQSKLLIPHSAESLASAEFMDFAPYPSICCSCLPSKAQKKRVYSRIYENKLETNNCPCAPWLCCTPEGCINDFIYTAYYSHPPFRVGMCPTPCCCIPCTCCGPPVIFIRRPTTCCCIDCRPCCGETIFSSPANCFDLKCCVCCGTTMSHDLLLSSTRLECTEWKTLSLKTQGSYARISCQAWIRYARKSSSKCSIQRSGGSWRLLLWTLFYYSRY